MIPPSRPLSADEIRDMFRDFDLDTEDKREALVRLGSVLPEQPASPQQVFIRLESSTDPLPGKP